VGIFSFSFDYFRSGYEIKGTNKFIGGLPNISIVKKLEKKSHREYIIKIVRNTKYG